MAMDCKIGDRLMNNKNEDVIIVGKENMKTEGTWSIQNSAGCLYVSSEGKEFYLAH